MATQSNLPGDIVESVALTSANGVAEQPAALANLSLGNLAQNVNQAQQNSVSIQQSQNSVQATTLGSVVKMLTSLGPLQAISAQELLTGDAVAQELGSLKAVVDTLNAPPSGGGSSSSGVPVLPIRRPKGSGKTPDDPITGGDVFVKPVKSDVNVIVEPAAAGAKG